MCSDMSEIPDVNKTLPNNDSNRKKQNPKTKPSNSMEIEPVAKKKARLSNYPAETNLALELLDNEPGFYQYVIRPMLYPGHEGELCTWLKEMGLMQRSLRCQNTENSCNTPMKWTQARIVDKYQWKCTECFKKRPIRDDSFFKHSKCSLTSTMRIILGWCKDMHCDDLGPIINVKSHMIKRLFEACTLIAEGYVRSHLSDWRLGGRDSIILVDIYPDGCSKINEINPQYHNNNPTQILCLAEAMTIPTKYWFHVITSNNVEQANKEVISTIQTMVKPGSTLVIDPNLKMCSYNELFSFKEYHHIIAIDDLARHNTENCTILQNLEIIWAPAVHICEEAQSYSPVAIRHFLYEQLWRRKFARTPSAALESLLHHIAEHYPESV